jgi:HEAT repeat protein
LDAAFYDDDLGLKIRALLSYMNLEQFSILRADIDALLDHPNDWVSAVAMQYLSRAYPAETIEILTQALSSPNPRQREYACDEVGDNYINELADQLKALLNDPDDRVQEAARCNLEFLIG